MAPEGVMQRACGSIPAGTFATFFACKFHKRVFIADCSKYSVVEAAV